MNNKKLIEKLVDYFLENDPEVVAKMLANSMLDQYRLCTINDLPREEAACLLYRIQKNMQALKDFSKNGSKDCLTLVNIQEAPEE